ncbi:uncharacterized protein AKAME5_001771700 [Lates japonicus]|uniref:Uncharacterized protein n=1 Tax=Lates japonicus TaxID=270547 RepID=A0AAD3N437_LATJO|nr:uncharacterized protein AKAME5_001771700 [Lates japonicus]
MQVVSGGQLLWIYTLIFTSLQLWGRLSASTSSPPLPVPTLDIYSRSKDSVVLNCKVPEGHHGFLFKLYRFRDMVVSKETTSGAEQVQFAVKIKEGDSSELFCCVYKDQEGRYSAMSRYLQLEDQKETDPTRPIPSFPPPVLSVEPPMGVPQASQVSGPEPQPGVFIVGPVNGGEEGEYTCIYQVSRRRQLVNSTVSNMVQVTITDVLPLPTLVLQQQTDIWHLLCTGSPAYPGAVFSLYQVDKESPIASHPAKVILHQATFPLPVQDAPLVLYQCQYSVLLGKIWSDSERSLPLAVTRGISTPSSSAVLVVVAAHRKAKATAEKKRKREEAQFWTQVHAKDHVVDLTLRRASYTSQEWTSGDTETFSRSPFWNPLSTFTTPSHPIH